MNKVDTTHSATNPEGVEVVHRTWDIGAARHHTESHKPISRRMHGVIDYLLGLLLLFSPWLFGFHTRHIDATMAVCFGAGILLYSLLTNDETGVVRLLPFPFHVFLDVLAGVALIFSFIIYGTGLAASIVFAVVGLLEFALVILTQPPRTITTSSVA